MSFLRTIVAALIVLGCGLLPQACLIAALVSQSTICCDRSPARSIPCEATCVQCMTLEIGSQQLAQERVAAVAVIVETLTAFVRIFALEPVEQVSLLNTSPPKDCRQIWHFVARTALPVRGPSFLA